MPDPTSPTLPEPTDAARRGIDRVISQNYVAQNVNVTRAPQRQEYPNQHGAIRGGKEYDMRFNLTCMVYAKGDSSTPPFEGKTRFAIVEEDGTTSYWLLDDEQEAGTYNDLMRWTVTGHRFQDPTGAKFPTSAQDYIPAAAGETTTPS